MALEIFRLVGSVFVDTEAADKSLKNTDKEAGKLGESLVAGVQKIGQFAAGVAATAAAAGAALVGIAENTREYRTEQGKLTTAFEAQNFTAEQARSTYEALNGVLGDSGQAVEAANHLAMLTDNEKDLNAWTKICTGVYATFGDSLPIEGLAEAANETAKVGQITGGLADAINWAAKEGETFGVKLKANTKANEEWNKAVEAAASAEDYFNLALQECSTEQERQALITKTLSGIYDESAEAYRENNAEVIAANEAQDKLNNAMAKIGEAVEPAITKGKVLIASVIEKATPMLAALAEKLIPMLAGAVEDLIGWVEGAVQWLQDAYTWMQENETLVTLLAIVVGTLTAAIIAYNIAQNAAAIATAIATAATTAFGAVMAFVTSPITLVVLAIGALIAIIYLLVTNWDVVSEAAVKCWEWIKETWNKVASWFDTNVIQPLISFFLGLWEWIKKNWTTLVMFLINPIGAIFKYCYENFEGFRNFIDNIVASVKKFFSDMWSGFVNGAKNAWQDVKNAFGAVGSWFKDTFSKAWTAVKNVFSTGGKIFDGIKNGISNVFKTVVNGIIGGINKVIAVPFNAINKMLTRIRDISIVGLQPFSWIKTFSVPQIPKLETGAVLERGQVGLLEGNGAEAVVPLHQNQKWIRAVARDMDGALGGASSDRVIALLMDIREALEEIAEMDIRLDTNALVGGLAKPMDRKLGQLQAARGRS